MANTILQRTLVGSGKDAKVVRLINLKSDGSQESGTVIFQNSSFSNIAGHGSLLKVKLSGSDALVHLDWDQTSPSHLFSANPVNNPDFNFEDFGGIVNPNSTGATGNILLTTSGLASGEEFTLIITIQQ